MQIFQTAMNNLWCLSCYRSCIQAAGKTISFDAVNFNRIQVQLFRNQIVYSTRVLELRITGSVLSSLFTLFTLLYKQQDHICCTFQNFYRNKRVSRTIQTVATSWKNMVVYNQAGSMSIIIVLYCRKAFAMQKFNRRAAMHVYYLAIPRELPILLLSTKSRFIMGVLLVLFNSMFQAI